MVFLIEYDRPTGKLLQFRKFDDLERKTAQEARLELELKPNRERNLDREVVILQARDEETIRRTHGRYFKDMGELVREMKAKL